MDNGNEPRNGFGPRWRLKRRSDYLRVQSKGRSYPTSHFIVLVKPNGLPHPRLGVTVSRKVGNAVVRNRIKRLIREAFRQAKGEFPKGHDVVVIAKGNAAGVTYHQVERELGDFCRRWESRSRRGR